jgi:endonuclease YncB( thermonuclease family)
VAQGLRDRVGARKALVRVRQVAQVGPVVFVTDRDKQEKYGRYLGVLWVKAPEGWFSVNARLVAEGLARRYDGGAR